VRRLSEIEQFPAELLIILQIFAHVMSRCDLDIGRSLQHCTFVSEFGYLAGFSNAGGSNLSDAENDVKFRTFNPLDRGERYYLYTNC